MVAVLAVLPAAPAAADDPPPPAGEPAGSGSLAGTERVDDWEWAGAGVCIAGTKSVFALRGVGTYQGRSAGGQDVVYRAEIGEGETLYGNGPLQVEVENSQTYYHGPYGTHGTSDSSCAPATAGTPVPAQFRIFAPGHVYRLDDTGAEAPCRGQGTFARGGNNFQNARWYAEWTLIEDCSVVGNNAGTPGSGGAPSGTAHTHLGRHDPCVNGSCVDNIQVNYNQYLPFDGLHVGVSGPSSAAVGSPVTVIAAVTDDGQPVPNAPVTFSVAGPAPSTPPGGGAVTGADGRASFTLTAADPGDYTVSASAINAGATATGTKVVRFDALAPPTMTVDGPSQGQTEENQTVTATLTNAGNPVPGTLVDFVVTGPGQATPPSASAVTDANGKAPFTFMADRAGDYSVTASASVAGQPASATHGLHLAINTFRREAAITLPSEEHELVSAVMDPAGRFAYFGTGFTVFPGLVVKVDLATFQRVGSLELDEGEGNLTSAVIDPSGDFAYIGTSSHNAKVIKIDLRAFQRVGALDVPEGDLASAVIDPSGRYAYFGTAASSNPASIVKIDLATFERVGTLALPSNETRLRTAVIDRAGDFAYFAAQEPFAGTPARVVKVDLRTFQRVDALSLNGSAERSLTSAVIDPAGNYAYFGTSTMNGPPADRVVKVDLRTFARTDALMFESGERQLTSAVMDPAGRFAYFGTSLPAGLPGTSFDRVVKVDLTSFERADAILLPDDEHDLASAVIDPAGSYAYFGTKRYNSSAPALTPTKIVKMGVSRPPVAWLVAAPDSYSTPYATPLSVSAPGVLANDADTGDGDPLTAGQATDPAHGSVALDPDGSFTYTPDAGFSGTDTFTYTATDAMDYSAPATVSVAVAEPPVGVQAVSGGAYGYSTNVSLFGGPASPRGPAPSVTLAPGGGDESATDPDGDAAVYGPARLFENYGPLTVHTEGATGEEGYVASSASVHDIEDNDPFHAHSPDGEASSTCRAHESGLSGSTRVVNGRLVVHTDPNSGEPTEQITFPHEWDPAPNTTYEGALDHLGDRWRIVFNEQVLSPDAITVNAVHLYLLGPTAVGEMIIGQSRCGVEAAAPNAAPTGVDDTYTATAGQALTVPAAGVLGNDSDPDGQPLRASTQAPVPPPASGGGTWTFPSDAAHGTLRLNVDGSFTYTPAEGYTGPDSFTYVVSDSRGKSDTATVAITVEAAPPQGPAPVADFDGDGSSDVGVYRPSSGVWYLRNSTGGDTASAFGTEGDVATPADYDGDGTVDIAVYRPSSGVWYLRQSSGGDSATAFGTDGDVPVPADYDGDAKADVAVYRPTAGVWYVSGGPTVAWGAEGDVPVPADYDGDGTTDVAVYRPSNGVWYVEGGPTVAWGAEGDVPVPADYDGDGKTDVSVFRPSTGAWYLRQSTSGDTATAFGTDGDVALPLPAAVRQRLF